MGNWIIVISGIGAHHNDNAAVDADLALQAFNKQLLASGQQILHSSIRCGGNLQLMIGTREDAEAGRLAAVENKPESGDAHDAISLLKGLHAKVDALLGGNEPDKAPKPRKKKEGAPLADRQELPDPGMTLPEAGAPPPSEGLGADPEPLPAENDHPAGDTAGQPEAPEGQG